MSKTCPLFIDDHPENVSAIEPLLDVDTNRGGLRSPAGWTHLTVGLHKLERLHQAKGLLYAPTHRQVVDAHVFHHTAGVDDEQSPDGEITLETKCFLLRKMNSKLNSFHFPFCAIIHLQKNVGSTKDTINIQSPCEVCCHEHT